MKRKCSQRNGGCMQTEVYSITWNCLLKENLLNISDSTYHCNIQQRSCSTYFKITTLPVSKCFVLFYTTLLSFLSPYLSAWFILPSHLFYSWVIKYGILKARPSLLRVPGFRKLLSHRLFTFYFKNLFLDLMLFFHANRIQ